VRTLGRVRFLDADGGLGEPGLPAISAGFAFTCGTTEEGEARCWGDNSNGQLGDGSGINRTQPVAVAAP